MMNSEGALSVFPLSPYIAFDAGLSECSMDVGCVYSDLGVRPLLMILGLVGEWDAIGSMQSVEW